jgi:hypothetical protein
MGDLKKYGHHSTATISQVESLKKGGMPHVFENLLTKVFPKHITTPFCGD